MSWTIHPSRMRTNLNPSRVCVSEPFCPVVESSHVARPLQEEEEDESEFDLAALPDGEGELDENMPIPGCEEGGDAEEELEPESRSEDDKEEQEKLEPETHDSQAPSEERVQEDLSPRCRGGGPGRATQSPLQGSFV